METQTKVALVSLCAVLAFTAAVLGGLIGGRLNSAPSVQQPLGGAMDSVAFTNVGTSTAMVVTTSSSQILATSTSAQWRMFQNNSPFSVYLSFQADKTALANNGIFLAASSTLTFSLDQSNLYRGGVRAIATGGTASVLVSQY